VWTRGGFSVAADADLARAAKLLRREFDQHKSGSVG